MNAVASMRVEFKAQRMDLLLKRYSSMPQAIIMAQVAKENYQ